MIIKDKKYIYIAVSILAVFLVSSIIMFRDKDHTEPNREGDIKIVQEKKDIQKVVKIEAGTTYSSLMSSLGISSDLSQKIYDVCQDKYDLANIKAGNDLELIYDPEQKDLKRVVYRINTQEELVVNIKDDECLAVVEDIPYQIKVVNKSATISSSLYQAALDSGISEQTIISLANAFQWTIDFSMDTKKGDYFKVIYEERYLDGKYVMPGKILAAKYVNKGTILEVYYFEEDEDNKGFFDSQGNSVQKMFLKAPVAFKYISSGFTTGRRYVKKFNVSTGHRAIDYAAPLGTPIRAVGDGTITFTGWAGPYGNKIQVRHNATYRTNYCHLSKFAVKSGQRVKQGEVIGYVGTTGFSTGPHLHFEMVKNGIKINPLKEILPPGKAIKEENMSRFLDTIKPWQEELAK